MYTTLKKLTAILLLLLFLFNTVGYRLFVSYIQDKADAAFINRLDKGNYSNNDLVIVKVPINLPYQTNWKDYERVDGEIDLNGKTYKYVKRKLYNDTMIFLCIQNEIKIKLTQKTNDYFGKVNEAPGNNNKKCDIAKQLSSDFEPGIPANAIYLPVKATHFNFYKTAFMQQEYLPLYGQPPKIVA